MSFYGLHTLQLDDKNRMRMPAKFRNHLGKRYFIFQGTGGCLFAMAEQDFNDFTEPFKKIPLSDLEGQAAVRAIMATVETPEEDKQGRFVLPANLKKCAGIDRRVVFIGVNERIEIWSGEKFDAQNICSVESVDAALDGLKKYDI
ncbi:MAG: division/cell wall cluster transcriptional repressor MraZ [Clostridia bacterium]